MILKRLFDLMLASIGLIAIVPVLMVIAVSILLDSGRPVFFRQTRVGRNGRLFSVLKFRTMVQNAEFMGESITVDKDPRVTKIGVFLREYKLDELPQLINVLRGDMSLVGPRPEVPEYVAHYPDEVRAKILSVRPGITDKASIEFRNENELLKASSNPRSVYINEILPIKIDYYVQYANERGMISDIKILFLTFKAIVCRG